MTGNDTEDWRKDQAEKERKQHELVFDACKHFSTLNTAASLVVLAIFRELGLGFAGAVGPLLAFGGSLVLCAYGMLVTAMEGLAGGFGTTQGAIRTSTSLLAGVVLFFAGLCWAAIAVLRA